MTKKSPARQTVVKAEREASEPVDRFRIPTKTILKNLDGTDLVEPKLGPDGRPVTAMVFSPDKKTPYLEVLYNDQGNPTGEGRPLERPVMRPITLGTVLSSAMSADVSKMEGLTLTILDRLELARRFRDDKKDCLVKVEHMAQIKKIVSEVFKAQTVVSGQALELLGDKPSEDL